MEHRTEHIIYVKTNEIVGRMFGGLENLITLSQALAYKNSSISYFCAWRARVKGSASRAQSGARSSYAEAQPALARKGKYGFSCNYARKA